MTPDKQPAAETLSTRKIAEGIVNQIGIGAWQFCSPAAETLTKGDIVKFVD